MEGVAPSNLKCFDIVLKLAFDDRDLRAVNDLHAAEFEAEVTAVGEEINEFIKKLSQK